MPKKPLPFKKGMKVVWLAQLYNRVQVTEGEVTVVTTRDGEPVIYCRHIDQWGNTWKRSFSPVAGMFQENPYPVWQLQPLNGQNFKALKKRAEKCTKRSQAYHEAYQEMQGEVHCEASTWEHQEVSRRAQLIPDGPKFAANVVARLGFKRPPNGVKVKVNGAISLVK
ncbi:hypothetical protein LCGC14_0732750 [marine sediment metagenome]|uniref:Uncharacterized protein n=1 Tax=marine sediment metagenome TaxID=412755 RepID=A0A0F9SU69_9ZZZZ